MVADVDHQNARRHGRFHVIARIEARRGIAPPRHADYAARSCVGDFICSTSWRRPGWPCASRSLGARRHLFEMAGRDCYGHDEQDGEKAASYCDDAMLDRRLAAISHVDGGMFHAHIARQSTRSRHAPASFRRRPKSMYRAPSLPSADDNACILLRASDDVMLTPGPTLKKRRYHQYRRRDAMTSRSVIPPSASLLWFYYRYAAPSFEVAAQIGND